MYYWGYRVLFVDSRSFLLSSFVDRYLTILLFYCFAVIFYCYIFCIFTYSSCLAPVSIYSRVSFFYFCFPYFYILLLLFSVPQNTNSIVFPWLTLNFFTCVFIILLQPAVVRRTQFGHITLLTFWTYICKFNFVISFIL